MKVKIAISNDNPLAHQDKLQMIDLKDESFYLVTEQTKSKCVQNLLEQYEAIHLRPFITTVDNIQSCLMAVQLNQGISIIDQNFTIPNPGIILRECDDFSPELYRILIYNKRSQSNAVRNLLNLLP